MKAGPSQKLEEKKNTKQTENLLINNKSYVNVILVNVTFALRLIMKIRRFVIPLLRNKPQILNGLWELSTAMEHL